MFAGWVQPALALVRERPRGLVLLSLETLLDTYHVPGLVPPIAPPLYLSSESLSKIAENKLTGFLGAQRFRQGVYGLTSPPNSWQVLFCLPSHGVQRRGRSERA